MAEYPRSYNGVAPMYDKMSGFDYTNATYYQDHYLMYGDNLAKIMDDYRDLYPFFDEARKYARCLPSNEDMTPTDHAFILSNQKNPSNKNWYMPIRVKIGQETQDDFDFDTWIKKYESTNNANRKKMRDEMKFAHKQPHTQAYIQYLEDGRIGSCEISVFHKEYDYQLKIYRADQQTGAPVTDEPLKLYRVHGKNPDDEKNHVLFEADKPWTGPRRMDITFTIGESDITSESKAYNDKKEKNEKKGLFARLFGR